MTTLLCVTQCCVYQYCPFTLKNVDLYWPGMVLVKIRTQDDICVSSVYLAKNKYDKPNGGCLEK